MGQRQHSKGKKRPRGWHRGKAEARRAAPAIAKVEQADQRARSSSDELRSVAARYQEDIEVWQGLQHASPFVPRFEAAL